MIGTAAALLASAAIGVGGSLLKGKMDSKAATQASNEQNLAALGSLALQGKGLDLRREGLDFTKKTYQQSRTDAAPWMKTGREALSMYMNELTGKGKTTFRQQPGYAFTVSEGEKGVKNNLAALGMKNSGAALKALTRFRTGLADQSYGSYLDRLSGLAGAGGNAVANINSLGSSTSGQVNNALSGMSGTYANMGSTTQDAGAARASGYVGSANAWGNALTSGVSDISNALGRYSTGNFPAAPSLGTTY
jgi:hypothetical protein